ncbi:hypothetical protein IJ076_01395 [Candidatus Saccharibacteria bacterium]|nr:hypothetical protein [Candidatus Saccharibacteria bacterium]
MIRRLMGVLNKRSTYILYIATFLMVAGVLAVGANTAYAAENDLHYSVTITPVLNVTVPNAISIPLNPASKTFGTSDLNVDVSTNNSAGYKLIMTSLDDSSKLTNEEDSTVYMDTLADNGETGYTEETFTNKRWGYRIGTTGNYFPFVSDTVLKTTDTTANHDVTTLGFAAKADYTMQSGTYSNTLNFTAVGNVKTIDMQNLDPTLCTSEPITVSDTRDGNLYTIARLADGKCWMTSNLNLAGGTVLSSDKSDVPSDNYYTLPASSKTGFDDNTKAFVYNSGNITTNQADCTSTQPCNSYYSWLAATAGNQTNVTGNGVDAPYSICPAGWRLPSSGNQSDSSATSTTGYKKGDFYKLAIKYGMSSSNYYEDPDNAPTFYSQAGPGTVPSFLLAGYYSNSSFYSGGSYGYYWSSSSYSSTSAYNLYFNSSNVYSASNLSRRNGFPVRCVLSES